MRSFKNIIAFSLIIAAGTCFSKVQAQSEPAENSFLLQAVHDEEAGTITVLRECSGDTLLVQNAQEEIRPFIHPIIPPDGKGIITEYRPGHHTHQTGLYWGLKMVNGRDFFMDCCRPGVDGYHKRISANVVEEFGDKVAWQTVYDLFDENGGVILTEAHTWSLQEREGEYLLDMVWEGEAKTDITFGEFYVGGLFLRMQWYRGIKGEVVNASGQRNQQAEHQRSIWTDVGIQVDGRDDLAHIAMFDHPENNDFPITWRVDSQLGVGPSRQIMGDWSLDEGETEVVRYRLVIYTGDLDIPYLTKAWTEYATESEE